MAFVEDKAGLVEKPVRVSGTTAMRLNRGKAA
jgi:hypothetical protein